MTQCVRCLKDFDNVPMESGHCPECYEAIKREHGDPYDPYALYKKFGGQTIETQLIEELQAVRSDIKAVQKRIDELEKTVKNNTCITANALNELYGGKNGML